MKNSIKNHNASDYFKQIVDNVPHFLFWKDRNSVFLGCNQEFALAAGLSDSSEIIGKTDYDLPWSKQAGDYIEDDRQVIDTGVAKLNIEEKQQTLEGDEITLLTSKVPLFDANKNIVGVIGVYTDISELKKVQKEAEAASEAKSNFIANMSHDLRTPMSGVLGILEEMLFTLEDVNKEIKGNPNLSSDQYQIMFDKLLHTTKKHARIAQSSCNELIHLFNEILNVSQLESGGFELQKTNFNLFNVIDKNIKLFQPVATGKNILLSLDFNEAVPHFFLGYPLYLDRCVLNILSNALKFTGEGSVKIKVNLVDPRVQVKCGEAINLQITIEDTGIGIPKEKFKDIFQNFSRLSPSYHGVYKGSGMGLYSVKQYLKMLNGQIFVESKLERGSVFTLVIPLEVAKSSEKDTSLTLIDDEYLGRDYSTNTLGKIDILLVEDQKIAAMAASCLLERLGCQVDVAMTGADAIRKARENRYDLIFMDIGLPDLNGIEVVKKIRSGSDQGKGDVPIVALTGHYSNQEMLDSINENMQGTLTKPVNISVLKKALHDYVSPSKVAKD